MGLKDDYNGTRVRHAYTAEGINFAELYSLRKDHKPVQEGEEDIGPKSRPVCGCKDCGTKRISYLLCSILRPLVPESETHCDSTASLRSALDELNDDDDLTIDNEWIIGSLDIEALYPSLDIDVCAGIANMVLYNSGIKFNDLKWKEIMLYLRYMLTDNQLRRKQLDSYAPVRRTRRGRPPLFTASGSDLNCETRMGPWNFDGCTEPDEEDTRKMWCEAIEVLVIQTMKNHCYKFDGKLYRQEEGGSIGLDLTGVMAAIYMSWWDGQLVVLLRENGLFTLFYKRYEDDINLIIHATTEGTIEGPRDKCIMEKVREIANTIHSNIKATCDYGSNYSDGKLPVLDLKIWKGESTQNGTKILYEHYMKDVSSRHLLNYRSAHPENMKISVLVNEALRIIRNCSKHLDRSVVTQHLQYFVNRMQYSGYPQEYRYEILSRAFKIEDNSQRPIETDEERKRRRAEKKKRGWYDKDKYDGVIFVGVTLNSELKHRVQDACRKNKLKIKVVEKMNRTIKSTLQRSNPYGWKPCGRGDCYTCNHDIRINCRARGCVYQIECLECQLIVTKQYRGQTGRSTYERISKEHIAKWEAKAEDSYLHKHAVQYHNGGTFNIDVKILAQCYGKPTTRMITEAVMIEELPDDNSLNSKSEWTYVKLPRVAVL